MRPTDAVRALSLATLNLILRVMQTLIGELMVNIPEVRIQAANYTE
jgi:hypothetical protein